MKLCRMSGVGQVSYLDDSSRRLREIPERNSEQTEESSLRLVRLWAASAQDAAPCRRNTDLWGEGSHLTT